MSVVVPAFNAARTLGATMDSVLGQSLTELELLVVDDGSTDGTASMARAYTDPRVRVISQDNAGVSSARNAGIRAAVGTYVAFLDADDLWFPDKLMRQIAHLIEHRAQASQTAVWFVDDSLNSLFLGSCPNFKDPLMDILLFRNLPAFPSTLVVERGVFDRTGPFDESLVILEDWDLAIRLARECRFVNCPDPLAMYRIHAENRSRDLSIHVAPGMKVLDRLFADPHLPPHIRRRKARVYSAMFVMLSGGAIRAGDVGESLKWAFMAVKTHPASIARIAGLPIRRISRRISIMRGAAIPLSTAGNSRERRER